MEINNANILVVDDHPAKRLAIVSILENLTPNIVIAQSGRDALRCLLDNEFAVILMDVQMPGMNGFETAKLIRSRDQSAATPIIFVTAYSRAETDMQQGYALGVVDFIFTPLIPDMLYSKVTMFIDLFHKLQAIKRHEKHLASLVEQHVAALAAETNKRQQAEVALRKLSRSLEQLDDSIYITDPNGIINYVNIAFEKITGYRREEVIGKTPQLVKSSNQDTVFYQQMWDTLRRGEVYRNVMVNRKKNGQLYREAISIAPVIDEQGQITQYVACGKDLDSLESLRAPEFLKALSV